MVSLTVRRKTHVDLSKVSAMLRGPLQVKVGFPKGEADSDVINKAIWTHFGTKGGGWGGPIPERPFLSNAMRSNRSAYRAAMKASASKILTGKTDVQTTLRKLGIKAQGDVQSEITSLSSPANSPVTIKLKGSSNPLIDTGEMRGAVTWKIDE